MTSPLISVKDLTLRFKTDEGLVKYLVSWVKVDPANR
jgi:hypothetical protein